MSNLSQLLDSTRRPELVTDLVGFVEATVAKQSGITGMTLKSALSAAQKRNSSVITTGMDHLLPDLLGALEPFWEKFESSGQSDFGVFLSAHTAEVSSAVMVVADRQTHNTSAFGTLVAKTYDSLRGKVSKIIEPEVPELGRILHKHM